MKHGYHHGEKRKKVRPLKMGMTKFLKGKRKVEDSLDAQFGKNTRERFRPWTS